MLKEPKGYDPTNRPIMSIISNYFNDDKKTDIVLKEPKKVYSLDEFEDILIETDELLSEDNIKGFLHNLLVIDNILCENPEFFNFFLTSHISIRLSTLATPDDSDNRTFFIVSDILLNLTAYSCEPLDGSFARSYVEQSLVSFRRGPVSRYEDFFTMHMKRYLEDNDLLYIRSITPILYNIASQISLDSVIDTSVIPLYIDSLIECEDWKKFFTSFLMMSFFRNTRFDEQIVATKLINACLIFIPVEHSPISINLSYCLYYFAKKSHPSLLISNEFGELVMQMIAADDSRIVEIGYSILSFLALECSQNETEAINAFFSTINFACCIDHMSSFDQKIAAQAANTLLNICAVNEEVFGFCIRSGVIDSVINLCKTGDYNTKIIGASFACLILTADFSLKDNFAGDVFETMCDLATIEAVTNVMLPTIASLVDDNEEACEIFLNSQLLDYLTDVISSEFEMTDASKEAAQFLIGKSQQED